MLLNPDPKRKAIQIMRFSVAAAVMAMICIGAINDSAPSVEFEPDNGFSTDGLYIRYDGVATVRNTYFSGIDGADISISINDAKTGEHVPVWSGTVDIPARSSVDVPVSFRISIPALLTSVIDSTKTDGSPLEAHLKVSGKCMYGLIDVTLSLDCGVFLTKEGTVLEYEVTQNDSSAYRLSVMNLSDQFVPQDETVHMTSGTDELTVDVRNDGGTVKLKVYGNGDLDDVLETMMASVDEVHTESGTVISEEQASMIAAAVYYGRGLL